jgi:hypothetical protein
MMQLQLAKQCLQVTHNSRDHECSNQAFERQKGFRLSIHPKQIHPEAHRVRISADINAPRCLSWPVVRNYLQQRKEGPIPEILIL